MKLPPNSYLDLRNMAALFGEVTLFKVAESEHAVTYSDIPIRMIQVDERASRLTAWLREHEAVVL